MKNYLIHICQSEAAFLCQGYLDKVTVSMGIAEYSGLCSYVEIRGLDRAGIEWMESDDALCSGQEIIYCVRALSAKLIEGVRRFEEDRELNLTP